MSKQWLVCLIGCATVFCAARLHAEEEAVAVYAKVHGSVVSLENVEGSGTGIVLDRTGLILTNAHVVTSPLPFKCTVDLLNRGKTEAATFTKVVVLGVHPEKDMALVRIDPKEHPGVLQPAKLSSQKAIPGQRVYAIGNPGGGGGVSLNKTITSGILSGVDRIVEDVAYYQIDAPINPGNSGGPLCDKEGNVIGIVTLKFTDVENVGFALPLNDLDIKSFVPWAKRRGNPARARQFFDQAVEFYEKAQQLQRTRGPKDPDVIEHIHFSAYLMHESLMYDPANYSTYYNVGMMLVALGKSEVGEAYLRQALEIQPWPQKDGPEYYRQLGLALVKQEKPEQAKAAWEEGIAKYGSKSGKLWEQMAVYHINETKDYEQAAYAAAVAKFTGDPLLRNDVVQKIEAEARAKLGDAGARKLDTQVRRIEGMLKQTDSQSLSRFQSGKKYLTDAFADYIMDSSNSADAGGSTNVVTTPARGDTPDTAGATTPAVKLDLSIPEGSYDLLKDVNVDRDGVRGSWKFDDHALVAPYSQAARLRIPTAPPEEYDLTLIVERQSGGKEFVIGLVRSRVQSAFFIDANSGRNSGLDPNAVGAYAGKLLEIGKPVTIVCKVRREGLLVTAGKTRVFFERTDKPFASASDEWDVRDPTRLFLGADASKFIIHKLMLTPYRRQ